MLLARFDHHDAVMGAQRCAIHRLTIDVGFRGLHSVSWRAGVGVLTT